MAWSFVNPYGNGNQGLRVISPISGFPCTILGWFKTSDSIYIYYSRIIAMFGDASSGNGHGILLNNSGSNKVSYIDILTSITGYNDGLWHSCAGVSTSSTAHELFVDGTSVGTSSTSVSWPGTTYCDAGVQEWYGGFHNGWNGDLAEIAFFNVALTANEIKAFHLGTTPNELNVKPKVYWSFEEYLGLNGVDLSGNANNGTVRGTPVVVSGQSPIEMYDGMVSHGSISAAAGGGGFRSRIAGGLVIAL